MKITKPFFTYSKDFNLKEISNSIAMSNIQITDHGAVSSFVCPTELPINGSSISGSEFFNICYICPNSTAKELAYFQLLFNEYIATCFNNILVDQKINVESSLFSKDNKICGVSLIAKINDCGIGWHSIFMSDVQKTAGFDFEKVTLPEKKENETDPVDILHSNIQNSFDLLRKHGTISTINLSL